MGMLQGHFEVRLVRTRHPGRLVFWLTMLLPPSKAVKTRIS